MTPRASIKRSSKSERKASHGETRRGSLRSGQCLEWRGVGCAGGCAGGTAISPALVVTVREDVDIAAALGSVFSERRSVIAHGSTLHRFAASKICSGNSIC